MRRAVLVAAVSYSLGLLGLHAQQPVVTVPLTPAPPPLVVDGLETDNGQQVRLFKFGDPLAPTTPPDWQGHSVARWETFQEGQGQAAGGGGGGGGGGGRGGAQGSPQLSGSLKVVTTRMKPGYLRRNGIPYSGQTVLTEYYDRTNESNGDSWLIVTSTVEDPANLAQPFMTSTHFKREADGSKWAPRPCEVTPEVRGRTGRG